MTPGATFSILSVSLALIGTLAVDRLAERVDDAAEQFRTDRNFENATGGLDDIAFTDLVVFTENHRTNRVAVEVQGHAESVARKLEHFSLHDVGQAVDTADTVGHRNDGALGAQIGADRKIFNLALDQFADFGRIQLHGNSPSS